LQRNKNTAQVRVAQASQPVRPTCQRLIGRASRRNAHQANLKIKSSLRHKNSVHSATQIK
jgi:hypothetical protein